MAEQPLPLAAEFPPIDQAEWRKLVDAALKGASFDKRLVRRSYHGLRIEPLYPRAANTEPVSGRAAVPWQVLQRVDHPDPAIANAEALDELENGAAGLTLVFAGSLVANGYGLGGSAAHSTAHSTAVFSMLVSPSTSTSARNPGNRPGLRRAGEKPRHRGGLGRHARQHQPARRLGRRGRPKQHWGELATAFAALVGGLAGQGFRGPSRSPTAVSSTTPAARRRRSWLSPLRARYVLRALEATGVTRSMPPAA